MFTRYTPEKPLAHVLYAQNEEGVDWYDFSRSLDKTTPKILINEEGFVCCMGTDAEHFPFPDNLSLVEVESLPTSKYVGWFYLGGKFTPIEETDTYKAVLKEKALKGTMIKTKEIIDALRIEKEYSVLSKEKAEQLKQAARDYTEAKNSLDALNGTSS